MNKNFRKLILPVSILAALQVNALGLGNLQVDSALDEVLVGEIPMIISSDENVEGIQVFLASASDYDRVGLDKSYVPTNIEVNITDKDNKKYITVSSKGPISEPIVSLLLVVDWANGHLLREYTILLDPPLFNNTQKQQNYSQPVKTQTYKTTEVLETNNDVSQTIAEEQVQVETTINSSTSVSNDTQVVVESGDTLWSIANRFNGGYSSPQQMMVAIFNNNPTAFRNDDMNSLKKGAVLEIPNSDSVSVISSDQAIAEVKSHVQNWSRLQSDESAGDNSTHAKIDYGIELIPPSDADSSNQNANSNSSTNRVYDRAVANLNLAKEELASSEQENTELSDRIKELEVIVKDQELAMSLKDTDLALLQQQLAGPKENGTTENTLANNVSDDDVWDNDVSSVADADNLEIDNEIGHETEIENNDIASEGTTIIDESSTDIVADESNDSIAIPDVDEEIATTTPVEPVVEPVVKPVVKPVVAEKSLMEKVLDYKFEGLIGLGVLLLGGLGFMYYKRRQDDEYETVETDSFLDTISSKDADSDAPKDLQGTDDIDAPEQDFELDESPEVDLDLSDLEEVPSADDFDGEEPEVLVMDDELTEFDNNEIDLSESLDFNIDEIDLDADEDKVKDSGIETIDAEEEIEDLSLDFDLDGLDFENSDDLDENTSTEKDTTEQLLDDDFDLDLDLSSDNVELDEVATDTETGELEFNLDDTLDTEDLESDMANVDLSVVDIDVGSNDDLGVESLDLGDTEEVDIGLDFDDLIGDDAVDTKLDLAKAYFEMGDIDGAKQMVLEIIEEGSDEQKIKAEELKGEIESS